MVIGPGSLFTSVLAVAAVPAIRDAVSACAATKVYVCNLREQLPETEGYDVAAHVEALRHARDAAVLEPETVSAEYFRDQPQLRALGARYLRDNIRYGLGPNERAGLELFFRYAAEAGVVAAAEPLRFF